MVTFTATVSNPNTATDIPTGSVSFYDAVSGATCTSPGASKQIGTQTLNGSGQASVSTGFPNYDLLVGSHTILACYGGDSNHLPSGGVVTQRVNPGIGTVAYIGQTLFMTSGSSSTTVQATLSASVLASAGSLANAKVTFIDLISGAVLAKGVPVSQVAGSTYQTGTANTIVTLSTGKYGSNEYLIQVQLDATLGSYTNLAATPVATCPTSAGPYQIVKDSTGAYCDTTNTAFATLTVIIPPTTNSMQGDAAIGLTVDTQGTAVYPAGTLIGTTSYTVLKKVHNTIGLTYNNGGTNPQGQIQLVLERDDGTYYIKSNSITSMGCSNTANKPCKDLTVYTKASIYKVAANGVMTSIDGNVSLRMDAHDGDNNTKTSPAYDTIGFTVLSSKDGSLYYSNNWIYDSNAKGWRTVPQAVATGTTPNLAVSIN